MTSAPLGTVTEVRDADVTRWLVSGPPESDATHRSSVSETIPATPVLAVVATVTSDVAKGRFARLSNPIVALPPAAPWPSDSVGFLPGQPGDAARLAQEYYGDLSLAGLLTPVPGGFLVQPGALLPEHRAAYQSDLGAKTAFTLRLLVDAQPALDATQLVLRETLEALRHPDAKLSLLKAVAAGLGAQGSLSSLLPKDGPHSAEIFWELLSDPAGALDDSVVQVAVGHLLGWMDQGNGIASGKITRLLGALPGPAQAVLLTKVAHHFNEAGFAGAAKYGEPTPGHMLQRFFESLTSQDRAETLRGLVNNEVLSESGAAHLLAGRSTAGRLAPMLTWGAHLAAQDYAKWANEGSKWGAVGGVVASLALPETAAETVLTLASLGLGAGLAARFPRLATALAVPSTGVASYSATINLQAGLTGKDPMSGRPLEPGVALARLVAGSAGVLLTAGGLLVGFRAGRVRYSRRTSASELQRLQATHQRVQVRGLPKGTTVFVPKGGSGAPTAPAATKPAAPAPVASKLAAPSAKLGLAHGTVSAAEAENVAASLAGSKVKGLMAQHDFGTMEVAAKAALIGQAKLTAQTTYLTARGEGAPHKKAMKTAKFAVKQALPQVTSRLAKEAALVELQARIADGRIFNRGAMPSEALARLEAFEAGTIGQQTKAWAIRLGKASPRQIRALMDLEVAAGRASQRDVQLGIPVPQVMSVWEMPDGTVVRFKAAGDLQRRGPTASVEMKSSPSTADRGSDGVAFKLDRNGRAVPCGPHAVSRHYGDRGLQAEAFLDYGMDAGHWAFEARGSE